MANTPAKVMSYDLANADSVLALSADLQNFINQNKLVVNLQGKEYPLTEAWQYIGSRLGILPIIESLTNRSTDSEIRYEAQVHLLNLRTGQIVGRGFAICSNKEPGKKFFQEYAVASMAQTRSVGKAYRLTLGWLIKAAGYEPTPYEEVEGIELAKNTEKAEAITAKHTDANPTPPSQRPSDPEAKAKGEALKASTKDKAEILLLSNAEVITKEEKDKIIASVNSLNAEQAQKTIEKLKKTIAQRRAEMEEAANEN